MKFRGTIRRSQQGYILLTLMLAVALLFIAAAAIAPEFTFQMKRDREEELIHRGVQYSRAIRRYYKKFGRYPTRVEELENSNNQRFLRRKYKDPITGKDFKLLHFGEVQMSFGPGIAGATSVAAMAAAGGQRNTGQQMAGAQQMMMAQQAMSANASPFSSSNSPFNSGGSLGGTNSDQDQDKGGKGKPSNRPTFGGGPIVGVASSSEKETIREFNSKRHYKEWQFVYDPSLDRGGLLNTPNQKPLQVAGDQKLPQPVAPAMLDGAQSPQPTQQNPPQGQESDNDQ